MAKVLNSNKNNVPLATDEECAIHRAALISAGIIKPKAVKVIIRDKRDPVVSTKKTSARYREKLIEAGLLIHDLVEFSSNSERQRPLRLEEGEYNPGPPKSDEGYKRRKAIYFWMIQDIFRVRKELKLVLGMKKDTDPDWYF